MAVAGILCDGFQRGRIRPRVLLGQGEAAEHFAGRQLRQVGALLFLGAVADDGFRADAGVLGADDAVGERALGEFDEGQRQFLAGQALAAVFFRYRPAEGAQFAHRGDAFLGHAVFRLDAVLVGDCDLAHEAAGVFEEAVQGFGIADHGWCVLSIVGLSKDGGFSHVIANRRFRPAHASWQKGACDT